MAGKDPIYGVRSAFIGLFETTLSAEGIVTVGADVRTGVSLPGRFVTQWRSKPSGQAMPFNVELQTAAGAGNGLVLRGDIGESIPCPASLGTAVLGAKTQSNGGDLTFNWLPYTGSFSGEWSVVWVPQLSIDRGWKCSDLLVYPPAEDRPITAIVPPCAKRFRLCVDTENGGNLWASSGPWGIYSYLCQWKATPADVAAAMAGHWIELPAGIYQMELDVPAVMVVPQDVTALLRIEYECEL